MNLKEKLQAVFGYLFSFFFLFCSLTGRGNLTPDEKKSLFYIDDYTYNNNDNNNAREVFRQYIEAVSSTAIPLRF